MPSPIVCKVHSANASVLTNFHHHIIKNHLHSFRLTCTNQQNYRVPIKILFLRVNNPQSTICTFYETIFNFLIFLHSQPKVRSCKFDSRFPLSVSLTHVFDLRIGLGLHFISSWFSLFYSKLKSLYFDFTHNTSLLCIYEHTVFTRIRAVALI